MPDLHTEMQKIADKIQPKEKQMSTLTGTINEWASDDKQEPDVQDKGPRKFVVTNNVSRETFYTLRDNPGKPFNELISILVSRGFKAASVGTLLVQMVKCGMATKDVQGKFYALQTEYTPIKNRVGKKQANKKTAKPEAKRQYIRSGKYAKTGIAALKTQAEMVAEPMKEFDPVSLLSTLSFPQVMALYKQIKTMLGEA